MPITLQDAIHNWQADEGQTDATMLAGQLEVIANELLRAADASLDLAYEQRTANLIAYLPHSGEESEMNKLIRKRLGLS